MTKNRKLSKTYLEIDRFFPSSKTCSHCYHKVEELPLNIRSWVCPNCNIHHGKDINASFHIRDEGLRVLSVGRIDTAFGRKVRLTSLSTS